MPLINAKANQVFKDSVCVGHRILEKAKVFQVRDPILDLVSVSVLLLLPLLAVPVCVVNCILANAAAILVLRVKVFQVDGETINLMPISVLLLIPLLAVSIVYQSVVLVPFLVLFVLQFVSVSPQQEELLLWLLQFPVRFVPWPTL